MQRMFSLNRQLITPLSRCGATPRSLRLCAPLYPLCRPTRKLATDATSELNKAQPDLPLGKTVEIDPSRLITEPPDSGFIKTTEGQGVLFFDSK